MKHTRTPTQWNDSGTICQWWHSTASACSLHCSCHSCHPWSLRLLFVCWLMFKFIKIDSICRKNGCHCRRSVACHRCCRTLLINGFILMTWHSTRFDSPVAFVYSTIDWTRSCSNSISAWPSHFVQWRSIEFSRHCIRLIVGVARTEAVWTDRRSQYDYFSMIFLISQIWLINSASAIHSLATTTHAFHHFTRFEYFLELRNLATKFILYLLKCVFSFFQLIHNKGEKNTDSSLV